MSTPAGIELSSAAAITSREDEGQSVHIRDAQGDLAYYSPEVAEPGQKNGQLPVMIRIAGTYSGVYRRALDAQKERMLRRRAVTLNAELIGRNQVELVAACVLGWEGFTENGKPLPFTRENAVRLLTAAPWIRYQLEEAQEDHAGFFSPRSPS